MCDLSPKLPYCEKSRASWSHRDQNVVSPGTGLNCEVPQREEDGAKRAQERERDRKLGLGRDAEPGSERNTQNVSGYVGVKY